MSPGRGRDRRGVRHRRGHRPRRSPSGMVRWRVLTSTPRPYAVDVSDAKAASPRRSHAWPHEHRPDRRAW